MWSGALVLVQAWISILILYYTHNHQTLYAILRLIDVCWSNAVPYLLLWRNFRRTIPAVCNLLACWHSDHGYMQNHTWKYIPTKLQVSASDVLFHWRPTCRPVAWQQARLCQSANVLIGEQLSIYRGIGATWHVSFSAQVNTCGKVVNLFMENVFAKVLICSEKGESRQTIYIQIHNGVQTATIISFWVSVPPLQDNV